MTEIEILGRIDKLKPGGLGGDKRYLTADLDVCLWVEPKEFCYCIGVDNKTRVYSACVNYGPFECEVKHEVTMRKGAVELIGSTSGKLLVQRPEDGRSSNWDHCVAKAIVSETRDDCRCKWSVPDGLGTAVVTAQVKMETARF